jgi:cytochrome c biogenesis protein
MQQPAMTRALLAHLGSPRLALAWLLLLGLGVTVGHAHEPVRLAALGVPFLLLALGLGAALAVDPRLRRQLALLVFHLALLALVVLAAVGRLSALQGRFELTEGFTFDGELLDHDAGPLHRWRLHEASFVHTGFRIDYAPGLKRGPTRNTVQWRDEGGAVQRAVIGDHHPLVRAGYRFYTTPNKGFAPVFTWHPDGGGAAVRGAVHLPSFPAHALRQARSGSLPGGPDLWVMLATDETLIDPARSDAFRLPRAHHVVVRSADARHELRPGERLRLDGGVLVYEELRTWMGYRVYADWTLPWLLAASVLAALSLAVHYALRFRAASWARPDAAAAGASASRASRPAWPQAVR